MFTEHWLVPGVMIKQEPELFPLFFPLDRSQPQSFFSLWSVSEIQVLLIVLIHILILSFGLQ